MEQISYSVERYGGYQVYLVSNEEINEFIQSDWDRPGLATTFGWVACECGHTDGTVNCPHKTVTDMISSATDYLDDNEGKIVDDPGYFDDKA